MSRRLVPSALTLWLALAAGLALPSLAAHAQEDGVIAPEAVEVVATLACAADPFPTLESWLVPPPSSIGYCYNDCSPCETSLDCGYYPCTSIPLC